MNSLLIFLVVALVAATIGFTWALMERGRANRAERSAPGRREPPASADEQLTLGL